MFPFHTEEFIRSQAAERARTARHSRAFYDLRALRGVTPPFHRSLARRLGAALAAYAVDGGAPERGAPVKAAPCPEATEAMSS